MYCNSLTRGKFLGAFGGRTPNHRLAQGLENRNPKDLSEINIEARGLGLHWPRLDVDLYVPSLLEGLLGTRKWMAAIGKLGGSVTSAAKAKASAENGKLGRRPKKVTVEV